MKSGILDTNYKETQRIDGLSPDAHKLRGHSNIIDIKLLTEDIDLAWKSTTTHAEFRANY